MGACQRLTELAEKGVMKFQLGVSGTGETTTTYERDGNLVPQICSGDEEIDWERYIETNSSQSLSS